MHVFEPTVYWSRTQGEIAGFEHAQKDHLRGTIEGETIVKQIPIALLYPKRMDHANRWRIVVM